jgi:hypothetical protein
MEKDTLYKWEAREGKDWSIYSRKVDSKSENVTREKVMQYEGVNHQDDRASVNMCASNIGARNK